MRTDASSYEVDNLTTGEGSGGGSGSTGQAPALRPVVLFGTRVAGKQVAAAHLDVQLAKVNGVAIGSTSHHTQKQTTGGRTVAFAGALHTNKYAFGVAVAKG